MALSPPDIEKLKLSSSTKQIDDLTDADLCAIFGHLPLYDRLIASEVCRPWHGLSRKAWLDITKLDLGPIPGKHIGAILRQCPNLRSVFARQKFFNLNELACPLPLSQLSTVKLFDCKFAVKSTANVMNNVFAKMFSENLQQASWNELVLHNAHIEDKANVPRCIRCNPLPKWAFFAGNCSAALTQLQLSGLRVSHKFHRDFLFALDRLQKLECFIFHGSPDEVEFLGTGEGELSGNCWGSVLKQICDLKNLREVCLGPAGFDTSERRVLGRLLSNLPRLEVLFLTDVDGEDMEDDLKDLLVKNSVLPVKDSVFPMLLDDVYYENIEDDAEDLAVTNCVLRILVLSGRFFYPTLLTGNGPMELPARVRFPNGFGSDPLPLLHIFVGKNASQRIRFANAGSDACIVHPINEPMPQFLARADIAPIFDGVWIAEKIKETARNGGKLWDYESYDAASSVEYS